MKLIFDQNLSRKLPKKLADVFPDSTHVILEGLETATDIRIREFAAKNDYTIITRDRDFADLDALFGSPPKTIWLNRENAASSTYEQLIRTSHEQIEAFFSDVERSLLIIG